MSVLIKRIPPSPNKGKVVTRITPYNKDNATSPKRDVARVRACIFENLPPEIVLRIVSYLAVEDVCRLERANRYLFTFCKSDIVWRRLFKQRWGPKVPNTTLDLPEVQKKMKEVKLLPNSNAKKKVVTKPSWKEAFKARVYKTCSMCNLVVESNDALASWMGLRFCKKCQRERFITKKLGLAMFDIKPKDFEQLRYFEIMLGAGRLRHPVRLYYIDDIQNIVEDREEIQRLKSKKKKQKKGEDEEIERKAIDDAGALGETFSSPTRGGVLASVSKQLAQEQEKTKRLEERLIKNQVRPFI
eukprot:TRINITY_DN4067_c0_g5_i1.p1 TRINITY_DN4067_c0_g5~~TRINITY_DN4067_c0_g5_i1.p1  ORF type:complete len:300 (+),score=79.62 TRINITY_DN4067_c0_g5_i1:278-1177(+)